MKTTPTILFSMLFALMTLCVPASADTLIAGFESGDDGFSGASGGASTSVGTLGATEGTMALQLTSDGGFEFTTSFGFFADLTNPENDTIKFDLTFTPDDPAAVGFANVDFGINSNGANDPDNNFQFTAESPGVSAFGITPGVTTAVELSFGDLPEFPLTNPDLSFAGLLLITNSDASGIWSFDNVRLHTAEAVPEPSSLFLLGGLGLVVILPRRRHQKI